MANTAAYIETGEYQKKFGTVPSDSDRGVWIFSRRSWKHGWIEVVNHVGLYRDALEKALEATKEMHTVALHVSPNAELNIDGEILVSIELEALWNKQIDALQIVQDMSVVTANWILQRNMLSLIQTLQEKVAEEREWRMELRRMPLDKAIHTVVSALG